MLLEAPQLLRLPAAPLTSSAAVAATTPAQAEMQQQPAAAPLPLPPAEWTRGMATATAATPTRHISAHADVQQLRRSIAVQTKREGETRGTSPPPPTQRVDRGINTEFTGGEWEGQQQTLCQQTRLLQEQAQRVEALTAQRTAMEDALAAVHEKLQQQQHDTQTAITLHITTCRNSSFSELGQTEEVCRRQLQAHESDARSMLSALQQSCARAVVAAQKTCDKEAQLLHGTQALHQLQECVRRHFLLDEARRRGDVREEEQRYRLVLWRLFVVAEEGKRQSLCAAAVVAQAEEAKDAALAAQHSAEQQLREALQREKELRLQYLHVLRLPTTTVVSINPKADGTAVDAVNNRDDDMPVHVRFARAHREAVDAMNAQRIHVLGRTRIF
ncbi:hypothetical protein DQ04_04511000 [Trypanosoma grayi]|uniref:hypothetical protein n=1 Tax=Trypanosoma grayi TaxID=71804 RepID=UPI0004F41380|nr:hypothetical protein DQ04_04511000 [Trypanosoma grayi]KEG09868.1 hypothetical protein DQ04_04511000 [Trypanosoma grayi]